MMNTTQQRFDCQMGSIPSGMLSHATSMVAAGEAAPAPAVITAVAGWCIFDPVHDGFCYRY
jgi:hypothetical protein